MGTSCSVTGSISTAGGGSAAAVVASRQPADSTAIITAVRPPTRTRERLTARDACGFITTPLDASPFARALPNLVITAAIRGISTLASTVAGPVWTHTPRVCGSTRLARRSTGAAARWQGDGAQSVSTHTGTVTPEMMPPYQPSRLT